jgi:isocitrate lyase
VADAEAGFGGVLNAFELMKSMISAGAAGVHWEDQLASEKKCGHLGGKVLIPTGQPIRTLSAARLAADVSGVPSIIIARTDAQAAALITTDVDERVPSHVRLQEAEFAAEKAGYTATRHQREVGTGYFDLVSTAITPNSSTVAPTGSTEDEQFFEAH